jgi:hypothetical protein
MDGCSPVALDVVDFDGSLPIWEDSINLSALFRFFRYFEWEIYQINDVD